MRFPNRFLQAVFLFAILAAPFSASRADDNLKVVEPGDELFIHHTVELSGYTIPYSVFVSSSVDPAIAPPILLAFHGSGERGSDGILNTRSGIGPALRTHPELFPAIVVLPQLPNDKIWSDKMDSANPNSPTVEDLAMVALENTIVEYGGDRARIYITGNSLGGFATWEMAAAHADIFAAAMPIAGGGDPVVMAPKLKSMPIWAEHGLWDQDVKLSYSIDMVEAVKKTGNPNVHFTLHLFSTHNVWDASYRNKKTMHWLFQQKLGAMPESPKSSE
jgi:predicted peptidase